MIRQPSTFRQLYDWHSRAVKGEDVPRQDGVPECGYYRRRMVKGGPWVPVRIYVEREIDAETGELAGPETIKAEQLGQPVNPVPIWTHLHPIRRDEYEALVDLHRTDTRMAATHVAMDITRTPMRP